MREKAKSGTLPSSQNSAPALVRSFPRLPPPSARLQIELLLGLAVAGSRPRGRAANIAGVIVTPGIQRRLMHKEQVSGAKAGYLHAVLAAQHPGALVHAIADQKIFLLRIVRFVVCFVCSVVV